ncbi:Sec-independent protein translocase subunit TatA/TatB [Deinococcus koreensis]|uniref:Sec-independent protein translocase protein TatA n=1 Tax=Deinococcus koreensis TaxID=2054903 RepID=A0A2K3UVP2_9DEIO|nr:twin-arginine translocase TatA/TatE family subunit [Deinococcus koreensis]PNY80603.1 twin-arginine translocase TatA/TatE family subunit [Deinococcus koreensis]
MPNLGAPELIIILLVALVVFGPRKLPELGKSLGHGLREFRKHTSGITEEFKAGLDTTPAPAPVIAAQPVPVAAAAVAVTEPERSPERAPHVS